MRLLTNDDPVQAALVEACLVANAAQQSPAYVGHDVLCALGGVLERSYSYSRAHVHEALAARARSAGCETVLTLDRKAARTATHRLLK